MSGLGACRLPPQLQQERECQINSSSFYCTFPHHEHIIVYQYMGCLHTYMYGNLQRSLLLFSCHTETEALVRTVSLLKEKTRKMLLIRAWQDWWDDESSWNHRMAKDSPHHFESEERSTVIAKQQLQLQRSKRWMLLLDVRTHESYRSDRRFVSSERITVVHIPLEELSQGRRFELPPRHVPFGILIGRSAANDDDASIRLEPTAPPPATTLVRLQTVLSGSCRAHEEGDGSRRKRLTCPWNVRAVLLASLEETWQQAQRCHVPVAVGRGPIASPGAFQIKSRLWEPDPMVEWILLPLLLQTMNDNSTSLERPSLEIWDFGAGVGRDVGFLAEELRGRLWWHESTPRPHVRVVGLDQRYLDSVHIEATTSFWKRRHVEAVTRSRCIDLTDKALVMNELARATDHHKFGTVQWCFYAVRYWNRPLFQALMKAGHDNALPVGTILAISQFGKPHSGASWNFPHPKEKHVLERWELRDLFATPTNDSATAAVRTWKILHDEVVPDGDHGRTLIQFVVVLE